MATRAGELFVPDWRGGVTVIRPDGSQQTWLARTSLALRPNAIALTADGAFLLANLGDDGGVWRLDRSGELTPVVTAVDGVPLPPTNFVTMDEGGRLWISVSTRAVPRQRAWRPDVADGFIVLADAHGARIVADGLHYTNEVRPDPSGRWLYIVETFGRRLRRYPINPTEAGGRGCGRGEALGAPEIVVTLGDGDFPDGFAFDAAGGIWMTTLISNRVLRVIDGRTEVMFEELNAEHAARIEARFVRGTMRPDDLGPIPGTRLQHVTSLAFGGADLQTIYLGTLHGESIYRARVTGIAGAAPVHWTFPPRAG